MRIEEQSSNFQKVSGMSSLRFTIYFLCILFILTLLKCYSDENSPDEITENQLITRGKYLVDYGGCSDCHTPKSGINEFGPIPDSTKLMSGHPAGENLIIDTTLSTTNYIYSNFNSTVWIGPWGISFTANITPDSATGIGAWSDEIFIKAMKTGKHMGYGRRILPPMPWFSLGSLNERDLKAVFAYLKSFKAVNNDVPEPIPLDMISKVNTSNRNR